MRYVVRNLANQTVRALALLICFSFTQAFAAREVAQSFTLDGQLFSDTASTIPLVDGTVVLRIQILNPAETCILYEETQTVSTASSNGRFSVLVGSAPAAVKRSTGDSNNAMATVFSNTAATISGKLVSNNSACSYVPSASDERYVRIQVTPSDAVTRTLSPNMILDSVPTAIVAERAETIQGLAPASILQVDTVAPAVLSQANLESIFSTTNFSRLTALLSVAPSNYLQTGANGSVAIPAVAGNAATPAAGQVWYDSTANALKYHNGTTVLTVGNTTSVSGTAIQAGTIGGSTAINTTGNIQTANDITAERFFMYDNSGAGPGYIGFRAPADIAAAGGASYTLTWPKADGTNGQVLSTDGSGNLSWVTGGGSGTPSADSLDFTEFKDAMALDASTDISVTGTNVLSVTNSGTGNSFVVNDQAADTSPFVIDASGNVGVGSATPAVKLDVVGEAAILGASNAAPDLAVKGNASSATFGWYPSIQLSNTLATQGDSTGTFNRAALAVGAGNGAVNGQMLSVYETGSAGSQLNVGTTTNHPMIFMTNSSEKMRVATSGNVGIGTTSPVAGLSLDGTNASVLSRIDVRNSSGATPAFPSVWLRNWIDTAGSGNPALMLFNSRGTSGTSSNILNGDTLGSIQASGTYNTTNSYRVGAAINFVAEEDFSSPHAGTSIRFSTALPGQASYTFGERMRIDPSGNVGVGTTGPSTLLDVSGAITSRPSGTATGQTGQIVMRELAAGGTNTVTIKAPDALTADRTLVLPDSNGTNGQALTTDGSGNLSWATVSGGTPSADSLDFTEFKDAMALDASTDIAVSGTNVLSITNTGTGNSLVVNDQAADTTPFVIDAAGNVGIGTSTPGNALSVVSAANPMTVQNTTSTGTSQILFVDNAGTNKGGIGWINGSAGANPSTMYVGTLSTQDLLLYSNSTERLRISASGNVGIGTNAPNSILHVATTGSNPNYIQQAAVTGANTISQAGQNTNEFIQARSGASWGVVANSTWLGSWRTTGADGTGSQIDATIIRSEVDGTPGANDMPGRIVFLTTPDGTATATEKMRITNGGSVGIGTTTPGTALDVAGAVTSRPSGTATGQTGQIVMRELAAGGTNTVTIKAPDALTSDRVLVLPDSNGTNGQALTTDGSGNLSWATVSGGTPSADSLDFTELKDALTLDASTDIAVTGTNVLSVTNTGTGDSFVVNDQASDTSPFVINAAGNVGIGTTSAGYNLDVAGGYFVVGSDNGGATPIRTNATAKIGKVASAHYTNAQAPVALVVGNSYAGNNDVYVGGGTSTLNSATNLLFYTGATNTTTTGTERMRIDASGNVGIGTTAPVGLLDVYSNAGSANDWIRLRNNVPLSNPPSLASNGLTIGWNRSNGGGEANFVIGNGAGSGTSPGFVFNTWDGVSTFSEKMRLTASGNLGIGTSVPAFPLAITTTNPTGLMLQRTTASNMNIQFQNSSYSYFAGLSPTGNFAVGLANNLDASPTFAVTQSGSVGIGTATPGTALDVAGAITSRPSGTATGQTGQIIMRELAAGGTNTFTIKAPDALTTDRTLVLPDSNGTNGQALTTDGSGNLSWATVSSSGTTASQVFNSNSDGVGTDGGFNFQANGSNLLTIANNGDTAITSTTASTTPTSGALTVAGGLGVNGSIYSAGSITSTGSYVSGTQLLATGANTTTYSSTSSSSTVPVGTNVRIYNTSTIDSTIGLVNLSATNSSSLTQRAYVGAVSNAGAGAYTPTIVIGQQTGATAYSERMRIDASGNVGIGTSTPGALLDVNGTAKATILQVGDGSAGGPSIAFASAPTNGFMYNGTNTIGFVTNGTMRAQMNVSGLSSSTTTGPLMNIGATISQAVPAFSFAGDNDTGMFRAANDTLAFSTAATEKMRIDASGNVGIGTTNPSAALHVTTAANWPSPTMLVDSPTNYAIVGLNTADGTDNKAMLLIAGNSDGGATRGGQMYVFGNEFGTDNAYNGNVVLGAGTASGTHAERGAIRLKTAGVDAAILDRTGKLGIGTTTPGTLLDVAGAITSRPSGTATGQTGQIIMRELAAGGTNTFTIKAPDALSVDRSWVLPDSNGTSGQILSTDGSGNLSWATAGTSSQWTTTGSDIYYSAGKVGIGTNNPGSPLDVRTASTSTSGSVSTNYLYMYANPSSASTAAFAGYNAIAEYASNTSSTNLTGLNGAYAKAFNSGTGTIKAASGAQGEVSGNAGTITNGYGGVFFANTNGGTISNGGGLYVSSTVNSGAITNAYGIYIGGVQGTNKWALYSYDSAAPSYFAGNVGIGSTNPGYPLDVNGNMRASGYFVNSNTTGVHWGGNDSITGHAGAHYVAVTTNGSERLRVDGSGNVGIGTANPSVQFQTSGGSHVTSAIFGSASTGTSIWSGAAADSGIGFNSYLDDSYVTKAIATGPASQIWLSTGAAGGEAGSLTFWTAPSASAGATAPMTERMRINNTGNIGIGTTDPKATLDVNGYMKLAKNGSAPVACSATYDGALALTSQYTMCVCKGGTSTWVQTNDGTTTCTW